jgi:UrcA family protein
MTKFTTLRLIAAFGTASTLAMAAQTATAADLDASKQLLVHYADLDLTRPAGAQVLFRRIQSAAKLVCSPLASWALLQNRFDHCVSDAVAKAVMHVDRPALSEYLHKDQGRNAAALQIASTNPAPAR